MVPAMGAVAVPAAEGVGPVGGTMSGGTGGAGKGETRGSTVGADGMAWGVAPVSAWFRLVCWRSAPGVAGLALRGVRSSVASGAGAGSGTGIASGLARVSPGEGASGIATGITACCGADCWTTLAGAVGATGGGATIAGLGVVGAGAVAAPCRVGVGPGGRGGGSPTERVLVTVGAIPSACSTDRKGLPAPSRPAAAGDGPTGSIEVVAVGTGTSGSSKGLRAALQGPGQRRRR